MSIELLLDEATDARIRAEWNALLAADLPSQARHTGASNAPHITLLAAEAVDTSLLPPSVGRHAASAAPRPDPARAFRFGADGAGGPGFGADGAGGPGFGADGAGGPGFGAAGAGSSRFEADRARASGFDADGARGSGVSAGDAGGYGFGADSAGGSGIGLPVRLQLGGFVVFGVPPRGLVLARLVAVSRPLQVLHSRVHEQASGVRGLAQQTAPDNWTPHITLASRLTPTQLAAALDTLTSAAAVPMNAAPATPLTAAAAPPNDAPPTASATPLTAAAAPPNDAPPTAPYAPTLPRAEAPAALTTAPPAAPAAVALRHWNGMTKTGTPLV